MDEVVRRRRAIGLLATGIVLTALAFGFGHRGVHAFRSLVVPGAGLYDHRHFLLGIAFTTAAIVATVAWIRWGMDWAVFAVLVSSAAVSAALAYDDHPAGQAAARVADRAIAHLPVHAAAHEFPLVVLVMGAVSWLRLAWRRTAIGRRRAARAEPSLSTVDAARAAAIAALADRHVTLDAELQRRRARRVGVAARARFGGDPLRTDHAHARAALSLGGALTPAQGDEFAADAAGSLLGVPASEPGWVRLIDGTLAAIALHRAGDTQVGTRWAQALGGPLSLRRGHRPSSFWTPLAVRGPRGAVWEHAAATGLVRSMGWLTTDDDWQALRTRALAAAARGSALAEDERMVAASRLWLRFVDDPQAARVLGRVTVHRDPIAVALDAVATSFPELPPQPIRSTA